MERRHSHISHFALCLRAAESFRRDIAVSRGPLQVRGPVQRRHGGRVSAAVWVLLPYRLNGSRQPGLVSMRIPRHVRIRTTERRLNQYISLNGESIDSSVVSEEKPITLECFHVSRASGLFRFTQRLITKPIPPICGLVVSAGEPINWTHARVPEVDRTVVWRVRGGATAAVVAPGTGTVLGPDSPQTTVTLEK